MSTAQAPHKSSPGISSLFTLARARWRQHWLLLLVITLGMIVSITLVCTIPLLSEVLQTAGLRSALTSPPENAELAAQVSVPGLTTQTVNTVSSLIDPSFQSDLRGFFNDPPRSEIQTPDFSFISPAKLPPSVMTIYATSMRLSASHVTLLQGRLPSDNANTVEIAITPATAKFLGVKLNDVITLQLALLAQSPVTHQLVPTEQPLKLHVVGIFNVRTNDPYWHDNNYQPIPPSDKFPLTTLSALTSNTILLPAFDAIAQKYQQSQLTFAYPSLLHWYYHLNPLSISTGQLDDLIASLNQVQLDISKNFASSGLSLFLSGAAFHSQTQPSLLEQFRTRLGTLRVPIGLLTGLVVFLLLFFISVMIILLVDRQAETIVVLRSRGASNFQIFVSLLTQCIGLSIAALIFGVLLTPLALPLIVRLLLGDRDLGALSVVMNAPVQALWSVRYYALITVLVAIVVMGLSLLSITRLNLLAANNASGRRARFPLWRRLNLDLFAALVALVGYGISIYLGSIQQQLDTQIQALVVTPLAFIGPFFLLLAAMLLLMRIFPWLLRLAARLAARGRNATPLLALAQISRAPRKSLRMVLLLALTISFAFFTLVFAASQAQRANDIASFEVGADFNGAIPADSATYPLSEETALYRHIPGVTSASVGYEEAARSVVVTPYVPLLVRAVDPTTYASTAYWTEQDSQQSLSSLMAQLLSRRNSAIKSNSVPAIITTATASNLKLHVGSTFPVYSNGVFQGNSSISSAQLVVIAIVNHIPAIDESVENGILVDYQALAAIQANIEQLPIAVNHVWLRTSNDTEVVNSVNTQLTSSGLHLDNLSNRYALASALLNDPLYFNVIAILALGVTAAFLLALFGNLLASWLSARSRLTSFVVLRALGTSIRGIASLFLWEQGIIYTLALLLGLLFGVLLAFTVVPVLVFTGVPPGAFNTNGFDFLTLQHIIPVQVTLPFSLLIALLVFVATCAIALSLMVSLVIRRSMSQELRLQDDARLDFITREEVATPRSKVKPAKRRRERLSISMTTWQLTLLQLRRSPLLISVAGLTMIAAIGVMCVVPFFSAITTDGGLHSLLRANPATSQILLNTSTQALSTKTVQGVKHSIDPLAQKDMGQYLTGSPFFTIQEPDFQPVALPASQVSLVSLVSAPMQQAASHLTLLQGRLPGNNSGAIETLLTPDTARTLGVNVGSSLAINLNIYAANANGSPINQIITLHMLVVGLIKVAPDDSVWHGNDFEPVTQGTQEYSDTLLVSNEAFLAALDQAASALHTDAVFTSQPFVLTWNYHLNVAALTTSQLNAAMGSLGQLQADIAHLSGNIQNNQPVSGITSFPYLLQVALSDSVAGTSDLPGILTRYQSRVDVIAIPIFILSVLIIGLMLYFVSLIAYLLVDRQADAIAVLRSRGASSRQIFNAMVMQSIILGLIALVIGPLLALIAATLLASRNLSPTGQDALTYFTGHLWDALLSVGWYALATAAAAILALIIALRYAAGMNIHALRQETARAVHRPIWQRLRLDVVAIVIAFAGYFISLYVNSTQNVSATRSIVLFSSPLTLITPLFLVIGCILLLLRLYPLLLQLGAWLSARGKGATPMLAFAHMARSPRQTLRVTLLLALTVAFAIFSLVFTASQTQRSSDIAAFESGADFSGDVVTSSNAQKASLSNVTTPYQKLPGVISASGGYNGDGVVTVQFQDTHIAVRAVAADIFAQTAYWTTQDSSQSLASLMAQLVQQRQDSIAQGRVPVIIDASAASSLNLQVGSKFVVTMSGLPDYALDTNTSALNSVVIAIVQHIPTVNAGTTQDAGGSTITVGGGMLLDYTTFAHVYRVNNSLNMIGPVLSPSMLNISPNLLAELFATKNAVLPVNHIWLHTTDDAQALAHVRAALNASPLRLANLFDRRALLDTLNVEPLYLDLLTLLTIGATITLLLVLIGYVLASWQNAKLRSGTFTTLRSLGATSLQVAGQFVLEQGFVFVIALLIGFVLGGILSATVVPTLVFSDVPISGILSNLSDSQFYAIQHTFPRQVVIPPTLGMALALFAAICIIAIGTMVWTVMRPSLGQAIRLNED
ncbi:MAG: FtsX-like permease family protein [Ktedonobacteraceae bacterium]